MNGINLYDAYARAFQFMHLRGRLKDGRVDGKAVVFWNVGAFVLQ